MREWWALNSDPKGIARVIVLMLADLMVFADYAHWHLLPVLHQPALQGLGLALYTLAAASQMWADAYLAGYFAEDGSHVGPMDEGPFRYVRHPRYAAAIVAKAARKEVGAGPVSWQ